MGRGRERAGGSWLNGILRKWLPQQRRATAEQRPVEPWKLSGGLEPLTRSGLGAECRGLDPPGVRASWLYPSSRALGQRNKTVHAPSSLDKAGFPPPPARALGSRLPRTPHTATTPPWKLGSWPGRCSFLLGFSEPLESVLIPSDGECGGPRGPAAPGKRQLGSQSREGLLVRLHIPCALHPHAFLHRFTSTHLRV